MTIALCIPAYNAEDYLPHLLNSAKKQIIPFDQILVYDDCSTDNTADVARKYGAKVLSGDINRGCSFGKNKLAELSICDWLHFHDADDDLLPNFTSVANKWITKVNCADVVLLNFDYRDYVSKELLGQPSYDLKMMEHDPIQFTITHKLVNFGIYKRASFLNAGGFNLDKKVLYNEDAAFHHRLSLAGFRFEYEPVLTCINYRYAKSMSSSNINKCHEAKFYATEYLLKSNLHKKYAQQIGEIYWGLAASFASVKNWKFTKMALNKAIFVSKNRIPKNQKNIILKYLCFINPFTAHYLREYFIRYLKPRLRS